MKSIISISLFLLLSIQNSYATTVNIKTNLGSIIIELNDEKAPKTVANFLRYVKEGFYNGTIFHRVIGNFMIQGGGFTANFTKKATHKPIRNEANNGLTNSIGTIAMARTNNPHSATAQFFINVKDNNFLNYNASRWRWGYAVFGKVTAKSMSVINKIKQVTTGNRNGYQNVPLKNIMIEKITIM
ncbi:peptidylprolyl isomerase [Candidatus Marithrix sp. Canyon 246]|uniref:peptidylprolyl isomerase n=1 Tax=Candidatus Marithrix sp. Canyon 246 TaxID=1827136 RepID=UPI00084A2782|nr:peptidylprolyl isomerase [Candidatus Marithrix sp. Canyon 246]